jgi:TrpR family trp operon transcriptional repressor
MTSIEEIAEVLSGAEKAEAAMLLTELLTESEINTLLLRWELMKRLREGQTQRKIAGDLKISLCKVTRGNKILKNPRAATTKILERKYHGKR